jgi:hypothetical protein
MARVETIELPGSVNRAERVACPSRARQEVGKPTLYPGSPGHWFVRCLRGGPDCFARLAPPCSPTVGQRRDDAKSSSAGVGLIYGPQSYVVDVGVAVGNLDCYFTTLAAQRQFDRLGAVEDRVGDQLAGYQAQDSCRTIERSLSGELFDKATSQRRTPHVVRQRQGGSGHGDAFLVEGHPGRAVVRSAIRAECWQLTLYPLA